ncbi:MAG: threonine synthase [Alphaproteobacteria bacterium]|nr:threonine synthase [Alphaproteobacteria bacterium]
MRYISTRGQAPALSFEDVLLAGLAPDGGLYLPETWPQLLPAEIAALAGLSYAEAAARLVQPFVGDTFPPAELARIMVEAYRRFDHPAVAPLAQFGPGEWLLELHHGPTLAFKDLALQVLGLMFDRVLARRRQRLTVVAATSGDTGSAAIEACRDRAAIDLFVLHPRGRVSDVQRRQMTTVWSDNIHNLAIEGTFDDCQALVKAMFADAALRDDLRLGAVNSINWARIMMQVVYYVTAAVALGAPERSIAFAVPTGNFGDVYAGYAAHQMGLPVARLLVATNQNDILARFLASGVYARGEVHATASPSMDIQVASNFERLLFDLYDREGAAVADAMAAFAASGWLDVGEARLERARALFEGCAVDEGGAAAAIARVHRETGIVIDPHTAVGVAAGAACRGDPAVPMVFLATAHPAKFPGAVAAATGLAPALPPRLADLAQRPERFDALPNDLEIVKAYVRSRARTVAPR